MKNTILTTIRKAVPVLLIAMSVLTIPMSQSLAGYSTIRMVFYDSTPGTIRGNRTASSYPDQYMYWDYIEGGSGQSIRLNAVQIKGSETITDTFPLTYDRNYETRNWRFRGNDDRIVQPYGTWIMSRGYSDQGFSDCYRTACHSVVFRPNATKINQLRPGETVVSKFQLVNYATNDFTGPTRLRELSITISGPPITLSIAPYAYYAQWAFFAYAGGFTVTADAAPSTDVHFRWTVNDRSGIQSHPIRKISAGQTTSSLVVAFSPFATSDSITVTLADSADGSYVVGTPNSATVYRVTATSPGVEISFVKVGSDGTETDIANAGGIIVMGDRFKIKATATPAPSSPLTVNVNVSKAPSGIIDSDSSIPTSITIPANATEGLSEVLSTETDGTVNEGTVTVRLPLNANYKVHPASGGLLTVTPAPPVTLSIAPYAYYAQEVIQFAYAGGFTVTADTAPATDVPYRWTASGRSGIQSAPTIRKISAGQTTSSLVVAFSPLLTSGSMTVTLADSANGRYLVGTPSAATVYKVSATNPGISISFVEVDSGGTETDIAEGGSIGMGDRFKIKATATPAPSSPLTVNINVSKAPSGIINAGSSIPTSITIPANATEGLSGELLTETDGTVNGGTVTVTVTSSANYTTHPDLRTASLTVDAAPPVTLSISPKTPYFTTGSAAFILTADPAPAMNLPFRYYLTDQTQLESGSVPAGQTTYEFTPTGASSSANVTVNLAESADNRYVRGTPNTATVYFTTTMRPGISISFVEVDQNDSETDIAEGGSIDMGERIKIKATATPAPTENLTVNFGVSSAPSGVLAAGSGLPTSITIDTTGTGLSEVLSTETDGTVNGGTVTVTVTANSSYSIALSSASLTVNALPITLSIEPKMLYSTGSAVFRVTAFPTPATDVPFEYTLINSGESGSGNDIKVSAGQTSYDLTVSRAGNDANVAVRLDRVAGRYEVDTQNNTATVYFVEEGSPGISISFVEVDQDDNETDIASGGSIDMGDRFKIKATATPAPTANLTVSISISESSSGIITPATTSVQITINSMGNSAGTGQSEVLSTETDGTVNGGTVTASLSTGNGYSIYTDPLNALLTVEAAPLVTLSIAPKTPYFSTGSAKFIVSADSASKINVPFRYYLTDMTQLVSASVPVGQTTYEFTPTGASSSANVTVNLADSADSAVSRYVKGTPNAATVYYTSESSPGISISFVEADGTDIAEGGSIDRGEQFKIKATATPAPTEDLTVSIRISESSSGIITPATNSVSIAISADATEGLSEGLMTSRGAVGGTVTVRLESGGNYTIHTAPNPLSASLALNANTVILTIAPKKPFYSRDGVDVTFIVTADPAPAMDLPIRYHMYDNVLPQPANENDKVSAGETTYELTIRAMQNVDYTKVRLAGSSGYRLGTPNVAKVFHPQAGIPGITISFVRADGTDIAEGETINMGDRFKIKVTATPDPTNNVVVRVSVSGNPSEALGGNATSYQIRIDSRGNSTVTGLSAAISTGTKPGNIIATLQPGGSNYKVHTDFQTATLTVIDASGASDSSGSEGPQGASEEDQRRRSMASTVRAIQPTVVASSAESTEDALESQFNLAFSSEGSSFTLGGNSSLTDALTFSGEVANGRTVSLEDFISGSSFKLQLFPEEGGSGMASIWGVGDSLEISGTGSDSNLSWDGSMLAGHLGFDVRVDSELVFGLASSFSEAETEYANDNDVYGNGTYKSQSVSMHPYVGWKSLDGNAEIRSSVGFGTGEITVTQKGYAQETASTRLAMLSATGSRTLYSADGTTWGGRSELRVKGDTWATHQFVHDNDGLIDNMQFAVSHSLLAAEASHNWDLTSGSTVNPSILLGFERNGGSERTELGAIAGGRISYGNPLGFAASGSMIGPVSGDVRDFGLRGLLDYDFASDGLGLVMKVSSTWGDSEAGDELFSNDAAILNADAAQSTQNSGSKHGVEMGYGLEIFDESSTLVPFSAVELADGKVDEFRFGSRMAVGSDIGVELNWTRNFQPDQAGHGLNLSGEIKW